jgi:putative ATP-binding cassette transporter
MPRDHRRGAIFGSRFVRHLSRLVGVYWRSADAPWGAFLLALAIVFELWTVWGTVRVADAEREILDALASRESPAFLKAVILFLTVTMLYLFSSAYRIYIRQALEIRWRRALTAHYVNRWIGPHAYIQPELHPDVDNPDQRIQEDVRDFVASALGLSLSLLAAIATLASFGGLLWSLSEDFPVQIGQARHFHVPGSMLWVAVIYGLLSMWITHRVGRRLVPINFDRLRFEADFRYGLTRFRDSAEAVALSRGEEVERGSAIDRFQGVIRNWWDLIRAQRTLTLVTGAIGQANNVVPVLVAAPAYFAGTITLGTIVQIRIAYGQVSGALAWFVFAYQEIARWRANVERLSTLAETMRDTERRFADAPLRVETTADGVLRLDAVRLEEPNGRVLLDGASARVETGERLAITGPSGTGKTLLLRAIAGIWPFGAGRVQVPAGARMMFVTQRPYVPIGTLRAAATYPAPEGAFADEQIQEAFRSLGLDRLQGSLDSTAPWAQILSPHEQQRLALARVLLHAPDWILLDKATSALDEESERRVYALLAERLPTATLVSIAHRAGVEQYHSRRWSLAPRDGRVVLEAA